ncbi:hypothetical protein CI102_15045, partial [Trichoderma harzianum]
TPLLFVAGSGHRAVIEILLRVGADTESADMDGCDSTALNLAAMNGHEEISWVLIESGADMESKDRSGLTPLSWAISNGRDPVVRL